ncbi:MAG: extracellular solute-binding protein [Defluviitaleaceae bacterium]|nr:extracellular solute-binding protein [Defluviitaleaceae bacterium]
MSIFNERKKLILIIGAVILACLIGLIVFLIVRDGSDPARDQINLTYANWNLGPSHDDPLELRMIQSFMDEHPHIVVEIDRSITLHTWMDTLTVAASEGRMPDVFMIDDIGAKVSNGWLMDITSFAWDDLDFFDLPRLIREASLVNGMVYALPFSQDVHGFFVNRDLFRELGIEPPSFGISTEGFLRAVRGATDLNRPSIGINHSLGFVDWFPGAINPHLGFFAYDGLGFALNSPEMVEAVGIASDIFNSGFTFYSIPAGDVSDYFPIGYVLGAFRYGQMGMYYGGAWLMDVMLNQVSFDWDFIGVPGGRSVVSLEVIGVYANTAHPEEAYLLAQWMGHGTEGNLRRLQYARDMGITMNVLPVTQNRQVLDSLWQTIPAPGLQEVYAALDRAMIDGMGVLPGYMQARFSAPTGVAIPGTNHTNAGVDDIIRYSIIGDVDYSRYSALAEDVARHQIEIAREALQ